MQNKALFFGRQPNPAPALAPQVANLDRFRIVVADVRNSC